MTNRFVHRGALVAATIAAVLMTHIGSRSVAIAAAVPAPRVFISEVHPAGNGNTSYKADWIELTNTGTTDADITGWKVDDDSNSFGSALALRILTNIPAGKSAVFIEGTPDGMSDSTLIAAFSNAWFGSTTPPVGVLIGTYGGSGIGLGAGGDAVNLFNSAGVRVSGVRFGAAPSGSPLPTSDNAAGIGGTTLPLPVISAASVSGTNGAFVSFDGKEVGSPGKRINSSPLSGIDLSLYVRVGRFALPEPTNTAPPDAISLLAQEASAVTYDWDTDTLFVTGDGGKSVVQVSKTGQLIDSMTLGKGSSPQGTDFYDPEGLTYVGGGKFVMSEERDRQAVLFTYVPGTTLQRAGTQTVKLGSFVENIGNEGISYDPTTTTPQARGFVLVKETAPEGIFQTNIDFAAGTATNGSATAEPSDLFNPSLANLSDFADVFALSNLPSLSGPDTSHLLVLSQEAGRIVNISRTGVIANALTIHSNPADLDTLSIADMQHEGLTMDFNGILYVVNENGGGDITHPELWVYAPSSVPNQAPTAVVLSGVVSTLPENTSTAARIKVASVTITDDGIGTNNLLVTGTDASFFEVDDSGLYVKAGTVLDFETKSSYTIIVVVDDPAIGGPQDATAPYSLTVTDVINEGPPSASSALIISEVSPWSSTAANAAYGADWFEVTNTGATAVNIAGWKMDDNSNTFGSAVALRGVTTIPAGRSAVFFEGNATGTTDAAIIASFSTAWFGSATPPAGVLIGAYGGGGVGLSNDGDAVNLFDAAGSRVTGVSFGAATSGRTFENAAGLGSTTLPLPAISTLSTAGLNGAFVAADGIETGSPGAIAASVIISEVTPWSSTAANAAYGADWFEVTNVGSLPVDISGWKVDDDSNLFANALALRGVTTIPAGKSAVFFEGNAAGSTDAAIIAAFSVAWFGSSTIPSNFLIGSYGGGGVGLSTGGDAVVLFDPLGNRLTGVRFPGATTGFAFDNTAGVGGTSSTTLSLPLISALSVGGLHGSYLAFDGIETGSPGATTNAVSGVQLTRTGFVRDRRTGTYAQQLTVTNPLATPLPGPFVIVLDSLIGSASLANASGTTAVVSPLGSSYILVPGSSGGLGAGASLNVTLQFNNPLNSGISYTPRVLNGVVAP